MASWLSPLFSVSFGILPPFFSRDFSPHKQTQQDRRVALDTVIFCTELFPTSFLPLKMSCFFKLQGFLQNTSHLQVIFLAYHLPKSKPPAWKVFKHCQTSKHANSHINCVISPTEIKAKHMQLSVFIDLRCKVKQVPLQILQFSVIF